jgi:Calx-beta domain
MTIKRILGFFVLAIAIAGPAVEAFAGRNTVPFVDNDSGSTVQFNPTTYTVNEAAGQIVLTVTLNRLGDPNTLINVSYATRDGSATAGQDYAQQSGTIVFGSGETQKQIVIGINNDALFENPENFFVDLSNPGNASIAANGGTATVTIADDDSGTSTIQFDSSTYSVNENGTSATLKVIRSGGVGLTVTVNYASADGTATGGSDYTAVSGTLTFNPGVTQQTISIPITNDSVVEGNETFTVTLSNPSAGAALGTPSSATVTIVDDDGGGNTVQFNPTSYATSETPGGSTVTLTITATRFGNPTTTISVHYDTRNGSATVGTGDYVAAAGTVTFGPGETQKTISITVLDDTTIEGAENFFVDLTGASNASISPSGQTATVTIADDDSGTSTIQFGSATFGANEGDGTANLTVVRSGGLGFTVSARYDTADQTAHGGSDYAQTSGTVTFAPGQFSKTISIPIFEDTLVEPTETFTVALSNPSVNAALGSPSTTTVSIFDDDPADNTTKLANISTRGPAESGNDVMIAGFIIKGSSFKQLVLRALGPSLIQLGVADAIDDPTLTLLDSNGNQLASNDDYTTNSASDQAVLSDNGLTPPNTRESAIVFTAFPGTYTAILRGKTNGIGTVEVYDVNQTEHARLVNISTRTKVEPGDNGALIAGFIVTAPAGQSATAQTVAIRAIGPSLKGFGINNALADPTLDLYRGSQLILSNDNWQNNSLADQQALKSNGLAPTNDKESALITTLDPGSYSAVVRGKGNTTGVALVEVYNLTQ